MPLLRTRADYAAVFSDPNAFATTMLVSLIDAYGTEALRWSPQTIRMETEQDYNFRWRDDNFDRLMAGIILITTDRFYRSLPDFIELCSVLSGGSASPGVFAPADASECAWGITEALLLDPPDDDEPFDKDIQAYIGKVTEMEGIITPPDILRIGLRDQDLKAKVHYNFSDDPEMFAGIYDAEASKTEEINMLMKERLALLLNQLAKLQLVNGNTGTIAKRMLSNLQAIPEEGEPLT